MPSDPESSDGDEGNYNGTLNSLSEKWLQVQLTHRVSATAANSFWTTAMQLIPEVCRTREASNITKNVPCFEHIRRKLYSDNCPTVHMTFVYYNKTTQSIEAVECEKNPGKKYPKSKYILLYEEAHIKVYYA